MEPVEIVPEPGPEERAAILAALADAEPMRRGAWGRPDLGDEGDGAASDGYGWATTRRRKSDGATRA